MLRVPPYVTFLSTLFTPCVLLGGVVVSVLATGPKSRGFKPS
jgi:hypothetical protein